MLQQSEAVGDLMKALAEAQKELQNPVTTGKANIRSEKGSYEFKYATLDAALSMVRPVLAGKGIAFIQRPYHDAALGYLMLETRLCHGDQWIATCYPALNLANQIRDVKQVGAAITYARRYSLLSFLGIAGEEETDGEDLRGGIGGRPEARANGNGHNGNGKNGNGSKLPYAPEDSATVRARMIAEIGDCVFREELQEWANKNIAEKNRLARPDQGVVSAAFATRQGEIRMGTVKPKPQFDPDLNDEIPF